MKNLAQMMKQAQEMQGRMAELQQALGGAEIAGVSGAGMVRVVLNGKGEMRGVELDPALFEGGEREVLEDLIVAAHNDAKGKVEAHVAERMREITGGIDLPPGLNLSF